MRKKKRKRRRKEKEKGKKGEGGGGGGIEKTLGRRMSFHSLAVMGRKVKAFAWGSASKLGHDSWKKFTF